MLPWANDGIGFREWIRPFSEWVDANQMLALALALLVPLVLFLLKSALHARQRSRELEADQERSKQPQRLPNETLERNRREEARYRKSHQQNQPASKRGSGPRFK